jgi:hypothetical protein
MKYRFKAATRQVKIGGKVVSVDSKLEERVIRTLDQNKYTWRKPTIGLNVGRNNYTPDLELSVQYGKRTHRAIVELKPSKGFFTRYIAKRMAGIASHYNADLLLLYADKEKAWYRLNAKTGTLSPFDLPSPGAIPIHKLYNPVSVMARGVYSHRYIRKIRPIAASLKFLTDMLEFGIKALFGPQKRRRRSYRRRRKSKPLI